MALKVDLKAKALIFDLDGTLSNSLPVHVETWHIVGKQLGFVFEDRIIHEMTGMPTIKFAERIIKENGLDTTPEELVRLKQKYFRDSVNKVKAVDEVMQIVEAYKGKLPMAVGTGASRKSAELQLQALDVVEIFDAIVSADDVTQHKPEPETFLKCASLMNIKPEDCQVFEDGDLGIRAANAAGMIVTDVRPHINYGAWQASLP